MVATLVIHAITWITTHLTTPEGWKAETCVCSWPRGKCCSRGELEVRWRRKLLEPARLCDIRSRSTSRSFASRSPTTETAQFSINRDIFNIL